MDGLGEITYEVFCDVCNREMEPVEIDGEADLHGCRACGCSVRHYVAHSAAQSLLSETYKYMVVEGIDTTTFGIEGDRYVTSVKSAAANGFYIVLKFPDTRKEGGS